MVSRRQFLLMCAGVGATSMVSAPVLAAVSGKRAVPHHVQLVSKVFGDGAKVVAVAIEYSEPLKSAQCRIDSYHIAGRTITDCYVSPRIDLRGIEGVGRFVILMLSPDDAAASVGVRAEGDGKKPPAGGPGKAGERSLSDTSYPVPDLALAIKGGGNWRSDAHSVLVADDFQQWVYHDEASGRALKYNLYVPESARQGRALPLVLFMHDAGASSDDSKATLLQGLGAVCWADPHDQSKRPAFVLAPQYDELIADDDSNTSEMLDVTIRLMELLRRQYAIDPRRIYATGQSGGCMMSIAMNIRYPKLFAASFLVAGQWDPKLVDPLVRKKLWILVSKDDDKAYPGQNAITARLDELGGRVNRAVWNARWTSDEFDQAFEAMRADDFNINYVVFETGTVIPPGQSAQGASGHRNTWRVAYGIKCIREWMFRQTL